MSDSDGLPTFQFPMVDFYTSADECFQLTPELVDFLASDASLSVDNVTGHGERARAAGGDGRTASRESNRTETEQQSAGSQHAAGDRATGDGSEHRCAQSLARAQQSAGAPGTDDGEQVSLIAADAPETTAPASELRTTAQPADTQGGVPDDHPLILGYDAAMAPQPPTDLSTPQDTLTVAPLDTAQLSTALASEPTQHELDATRHLGLRVEELSVDDLQFQPETAGLSDDHQRASKRGGRGKRGDGSGERKRKPAASKARAPWKRADEAPPRANHPIHLAVWMEAPPTDFTPGEIELVFVADTQNKEGSKKKKDNKDVEWAPYALRRLRIGSTRALYMEYSRFDDATLYMPQISSLEDLRQWVLSMIQAGRDILADHRQRNVFNLPIEHGGEAFSSITHLRTVHHQRHALDHATYAIVLVMLGRVDERCGRADGPKCFACDHSANRSQYAQHVTKCLSQFEQTKRAWVKAQGTRRWIPYDNQLQANDAKRKKLVSSIAKDFFGCASKDERDYMQYAPQTVEEGRAAADALRMLEDGDDAGARRRMPALGPARVRPRTSQPSATVSRVPAELLSSATDNAAGRTGEDDQQGDDEEQDDDDDIPLSEIRQRNSDAGDRYSPARSDLVPSTITSTAARRSSSAVQSPARNDGCARRPHATAPSTPASARSSAGEDVVITSASSRRPRTKTTQRKVKAERVDTICRYLSPPTLSSPPGQVVQVDVHASADSQGTTPPTLSPEQQPGPVAPAVSPPDAIRQQEAEVTTANEQNAPAADEQIMPAADAQNALAADEQNAPATDEQSNVQPPSPTNSQLDGLEDNEDDPPPAATQPSPAQPSVVTEATAMEVDSQSHAAAVEVIEITDSSTAVSTRPPSDTEIKTDVDSPPDNTPPDDGTQAGTHPPTTSSSVTTQATVTPSTPPRPQDGMPADRSESQRGDGNISLTPAQFQLLMRAAGMQHASPALASSTAGTSSDDLTALHQLMATAAQCGAAHADDSAIRQTLQFSEVSAAQCTVADTSTLPTTAVTVSPPVTVTADIATDTVVTSSQAAQQEHVETQHIVSSADAQEHLVAERTDEPAAPPERVVTERADDLAGPQERTVVAPTSRAALPAAPVTVADGTTPAPAAEQPATSQHTVRSQAQLVTQVVGSTVTVSGAITTSASTVQPVTIVSVTPIVRATPVQPTAGRSTTGPAASDSTSRVAPVMVEDDDDFVTVARPQQQEDVITIDDAADYTTEVVRVPVSFAPAVRAALRAPSPVPPPRARRVTRVINLPAFTGRHPPPARRPAPVIAVRPNETLYESLGLHNLRRPATTSRHGRAVLNRGARFRQAYQPRHWTAAMPGGRRQSGRRRVRITLNRPVMRPQAATTSSRQEQHVNLDDTDDEIVLSDDNGEAAGRQSPTAPTPAAEIEISDDTTTEATDADVTLVGSAAAAADTPTIDDSVDRAALLATPSTPTADRSSVSLQADQSRSADTTPLVVHLDTATGGMSEVCGRQLPAPGVEASIQLDISPEPDHSYATTGQRNDSDAHSELSGHSDIDLFAFSDDESVHSAESDSPPPRGKRRLSNASETGSSPRRARLDSGDPPPDAADDTLVDLVSDDAETTLTAEHAEEIQPAHAADDTTSTSLPASQLAAPTADNVTLVDSSMDTDDEIRMARAEIDRTANETRTIADTPSADMEDSALTTDEQTSADRACVAAAEAYEASQQTIPAAEPQTTDGTGAGTAQPSVEPGSQQSATVAASERDDPPPVDTTPLGQHSRPPTPGPPAARDSQPPVDTPQPTATDGTPSQPETAVTAGSNMRPAASATTSLTSPPPAQQERQIVDSQPSTSRVGVPTDPLQALRVASATLPPAVAQRVIRDAQRALERHERGEDVSQQETPQPSAAEVEAERKKREDERRRHRPMVAEIHAPQRPPGPPTLITLCITTMQAASLRETQALFFLQAAARRHIQEARDTVLAAQQASSTILTQALNIQHAIQPARRQLRDLEQQLAGSDHAVEQLGRAVPQIAEEVATPYNNLSRAMGTGRQVTYNEQTHRYQNLPRMDDTAADE